MKGQDKKLPKKIREMQEALARRKEAEERKRREEEEWLRKEEEELCRQEQLEEDKRRKKEKEKQKFQEKKEQGKILTNKQKEEARRLEAMRNQILANARVPLPSAATVVQTKRPKYNQKGTHQQAYGAAPDQRVENVEAKERTTRDCVQYGFRES
jgi:translation initiation factor 5B